MESESDPLTRRAVDLFEKEPLKGNSEVHLHTPKKFGEDRSKDLGGDREQTDRQTNRQTDKRCSIYSMILARADCSMAWNFFFPFLLLPLWHLLNTAFFYQSLSMVHLLSQHELNIRVADMLMLTCLFIMN